MSRILGIDYGDSRVGLAITDALELTAQGLKTINYRGNDRILFSELDKIISKYEVNTIVVGLPINMNGTLTERGEITQRFIHKLKSQYNKIKIDSIDERLTTVQAQKTLNDLNIKSTKKKGIVDTISAVYILETYINKK